MNPQLQKALHEKHQQAMQSAARYIADVTNAFDHLATIPFFGNQERYWRLGWCNFGAKRVTVEMHPLPQPEDAPTGTQFAKFQGGFIAKTEQSLRAAGYHTEIRRSPNRARSTTAPEADPPMDIVITAYRVDDNSYRDYDRETIDITFYAVVPEQALDDPACHVEYTPVEVPAHTEYVARVVCNDEAKEPALTT